ncbi:hypothetical protein [Geopsychrobacter electrodiphilus]|uniref:hypothetical protein n=1 Tax=Geopsychrobacter electrodiphilus TaxID=225196 RepID=UPI00035D1BEE|nr:hypothetical protein [Geopsychrobacter electrodiphilus]
MNCPTCNHHNHNEVDLHSDGFAEGIIECSDCGTIWTNKLGQVNVINKPVQLQTAAA